MDQQHHGKTDLSIELAKRIKGEIISCDSMQIYQDMQIGTAKPTVTEMQGIKHYLIDILPPNQRFSVSEYKIRAEEAIKEILQKGKKPIVVGGTGLYMDSLIKGIQYPDITIDEKYREELELLAEKKGLSLLYQKACAIDKEAMKTISPNDKKRIIRVLEIWKQTGKTKTELEIESRKQEIPYQYKMFGITMPREILYEKINQRVEKMVKLGLQEEVENLLVKYKEFPTAMQSLGYKETRAYLRGELNREEWIEMIKRETRRYAKRQLTWFRRNKEIIWLDGLKTKQENTNLILEEIGE